MFRKPAWSFLVAILATPAVVAAPDDAGGSSPALRADTSVRDRLWLWGQPAGSYDRVYFRRLARTSTIEPAAAAAELGLHNLMFVQFRDRPEPPFDAYFEPLAGLRRVYWSLVGTDGKTSPRVREAAFRLAEENENIVGFVLDDFFQGYRTGNAGDAPAGDGPFEAPLSPEELRELRHREVRGKRLPLLAVVYSGQISPRLKHHLAEIDEVCLKTLAPIHLRHLDRNLAALEEVAPGKAVYLACNLYDFRSRSPLATMFMEQQVEAGHRWLREGRIRGMVFLASPAVDVDLETVAWTREWIAKAGDEPLARHEGTE